VPPVNGTLVFVRHGESTWVAEGRFQGAADPPLSQLGRRQAELVAARLARPDQPPPLPIPSGRPIGIWHSPLGRAADVASRVAASTGDVPRHPDERLAEIRQGEWEGLTQAQVSARYGRELDAWRRDPTNHHAPGGESLAQVAERVGAALADILATFAAEDDTARTASPVPGYSTVERQRPWAVMVGHDGVFRVALLRALILPLDRFWTFPFALAGITVVDVGRDRAVLRAHNLVDHLAPLAQEVPADWQGHPGAM